MVTWPLAFTRRQRGQRILESHVNEMQEALEAGFRRRFPVEGFGAVAEADPGTANATANTTAINAAIAAAAAAGGGDVVVAGKYAINGPINMKAGVRIVGQRPVYATAAADKTGSWIFWRGGSSGTMVNAGTTTQTVGMTDATIEGIGLDGNGQTGVVVLSIRSNSVTSSAYATFNLMFRHCYVNNAGQAVQWGDGATEEQADFTRFEHCIFNHCGLAGVGIVVNAGNCADASGFYTCKFLDMSTAGNPYIDLVVGSSLTFENCGAGGDGTNGRDFIRVGAAAGNLTLIACQTEKMRYFLRHLGGNEANPVVLINCILDDDVSIEGTGARVVSHGTLIKSRILLSSSGAKWEGTGDYPSNSFGPNIVLTAGAVYHNSRPTMGSTNGMLFAGEEIHVQPGTGAFTKIAERVVRTGRRAPTWAASTAYSPAITEKSWAPTTAYALNDLVTPTIGNSKRYKATTAGTSGATEPLWHPDGTNTYSDGSVVWTLDTTSASLSPASTVYRVPTVDNGHVYKLVQAGTSGAAEPTWGTGAGSLTTDNTCIWQETGASPLVRSMPFLAGDDGSAAPTTGWFERGHIRWNNGPDAGEELGWICVLAGNPGTWVPLPNTPRARVVTTGPVTMGRNDRFLLCRITGALAVTLPASSYDGEEFVVADDNGTAATNNITVSSAAGNINGAATYVINTNYGRARFVRGDSRWTVVGA